MMETMVREMETDIVVRQNQILDLIQDSVESDNGSSVCPPTFQSGTALLILNYLVPWKQPFLRSKVDVEILPDSVQRLTLCSSDTISLLPGIPKIFHGRETVLENILQILLRPPARVAILGSAGIGKTSLALAALHDPRIVLKFPRRYFVSCESVLTVQELLITMASHLGTVAMNRDLKRVILQFLAEGGPCTLVLDNFETPWEFSKEGRSKIEEFLSLLTEIEQLAVVV
jgi:hypothetical protein